MRSHTYKINKMLKDVLKEAREARKLKQTEVAEYVGVTPQTYMKWENGKNSPKAENIKLLAEILKVSESEICRGEVKNFKMDSLEFFRRVGVLMKEVPQTELLIAMHEYINDTKGFINMLAKVSDYPYELFDIKKSQNEIDNEIFHAKMTLAIIEKDGEAAFPSKEDMDKVKAHSLDILNKYADVRS